MKLTINRLRKLIKEELNRLRLNEGAIDWMLVAYWVSLEGQMGQGSDQNPSTDVVNAPTNIAKQRDMVVAVILLRALAKMAGIMGGAMQENHMSTVYELSEEEQIVQAFREISPNEVMETLNTLSSQGATGLESIAPEDILTIGDQELVAIMNRYDPIGYYHKNQ